MAVPASRNGDKMIRLISTILLIFVTLLIGCSSGEAVSGNSYYFETDDQYYINKFPSDIPITGYGCRNILSYITLTCFISLSIDV